MNCRNCGQSCMSSDKFCGNCGATILSPPPQAEQVIPKPVAQQAAPPVSRKSRKKWLFAAAGVLLVPVLILVVSISSKASGDTELTSGVLSTVPEGWLARDGAMPGTTQVIPESYRGTDINNFTNIASEEAVIAFNEEEGGAKCDAQPDGVNTGSLEIASGYDENLSASGALADGNGTVAGKPSKWVLNYGADAGPRFLEGEVPPASSEYPLYNANISLLVCVEELNLRAELFTSSSPFGFPPEYSGTELTATNNASTPEVRDETHQELERRYEANIRVLLSILENVDTDGWDGSTDLDSIPTTLDLLNDIPEDPFQGELVDNAFEVTESFDDSASKPEEETTSLEEETTFMEEETTPLEEETTDGYETAENFIFDYYDAVEQEDWEATYSMLAEDSQEEFTEEEWVEIQEIRRTSEGEPASLESVDTEVTGEFVLSTDLTFSDGSTGTTTVLDTPSSEEYGRLLTEEDISYLENLAGGNEESGDESAAVEEAVRGHYGAIGDRSFYEAYSYFGPTFRNTVSEETWVEEEESFDIQSSTIYSVEVDEVSKDIATATVDVGFEDNTGSPRFTVTWSLVQEGGEWKLDDIS